MPFTTLLGAGISSVMVGVAPWSVLRSTAGLPGWFAIGLALVLMDGCNWVTHLADHRLGPLWRIHAVHHTQEELSVLTTFRAHPLVHTTSTFAATLPVVALTGYHPMTPALVWDVLARRAVFPTPLAPPCTTGLAGRPLEVEQARAHYRPVRLLVAQLVEPFTRPLPEPARPPVIAPGR